MAKKKNPDDGKSKPEDPKQANQKPLGERIEDLKAQVREFPQTSGVYIMKNDKDTVIYVGKAKNLRHRVRSYFSQGKDVSVKTTYLVAKIQHIDYILTDTEVEAFLLEASLIKKYKPRYNVRLKDDRNYPYIKCSVKHDFPKFSMCRKVKHDGSLYFGPYTSGFAVRETIDFVNKTYKIRDCKNSDFTSRKRPCMTYEIHRCKAPCVDYISKKEYSDDLSHALEFLRGEDQKVTKLLEDNMNEASDNERYEAAARYRDALYSVKKIWERQNVVDANGKLDQDAFVFVGDHRGTLVESIHARSGRVIGSRYTFLPRLDKDSPDEEIKEWFTSFLSQYYMENVIPDQILVTVDLGGDILKLLRQVFLELQGRQADVVHVPSGEKNELIHLAYKNAEAHFKTQVTKQEGRLNGLLEIKERFGLSETPIRIECFDISNLQGEESVASQVVFEDGLPKKSDYRRYKIKTVEGPNDFASMKEVLSRRLAHREYADPDLIVVDGGKGQLKMAIEVLKDLKRPDIPLVGLAKARTKGKFEDQAIEV